MDPHAEEMAQRSADRLAVALEDVGFDVGRAFPGLRGGVDRYGTAFVEVGRVSLSTAFRLAAVLSEAGQRGVTLGPE